MPGVAKSQRQRQGTTNYNEATASYTVTVQALGTLVLNLNTIADDDTINIAEKAAGFSISGDTGSEADVSVTVSFGETDLTATSSDNDGTAEWSVSVPAAASYITESSVEVVVNATKSGYTAADEESVTLTVDLSAPTAPTYTVPTSLQVGTELGALSPTGGTDVNSYAASGLPDGLTIGETSGEISGTPTTADANTSAVTVTVSDSAGNSDTVDITFPLVAKGDQTLTGFAYSASSITFGDTAPTVTAPTGAQTALTYAASPATVCTVDSANGELTVLDAGDCEITATAAATTDYNAATVTFTISVQSLGTLVLNLDTITDDGTINIAEKAAGFSISGDTGSEADVSVTVSFGETDLTATSSDNDGTAEWSVSVPAAASYITESSVEVVVNATKSGYTAADEESVTLTVDLSAPTAPTYTVPTSLQVGTELGALSPTGGTDVNSYAASGLAGRSDHR